MAVVQDHRHRRATAFELFPDIRLRVAGIIFVHFAVNIGMTMGLMPTIGIPLPFVSYGGSSLIGFTLMIAVLIKLDSNRNLA